MKLIIPMLFLQLIGFSQNPGSVDILASVRNAKGQIVATLNKEDFSIEEDGRPRLIHTMRGAGYVLRPSD